MFPLSAPEVRGCLLWTSPGYPFPRAAGQVWAWLRSYFSFFFFQDLFIYLIYFWPCWVFIAVCRLLAAVASLPVENRLQSTRSVVVGLVALRHVGSSQTRDQTCVPCIGKQFLNLWTTSEAPSV